MILLLAVCLLTGCNKDRTSLEDTDSGYREDISPKSLVEAVASELSDEYWADAVLEQEILDDWYGISAEMYEEFYGQTPMISANVDALIRRESQRRASGGCTECTGYVSGIHDPGYPSVSHEHPQDPGISDQYLRELRVLCTAGRFHGGDHG